MTLAGFAIYAALINVVPLLVETGFSTQQAAIVLAVGGIGQVAGRIAYAPVLGPSGPDTKVTVVLLVTTVTTVGLAFTPGPLLALCAISLDCRLSPRLVHPHPGDCRHDRWGTASYGARSGVLSGAVHLATATAPWLGALAAVALGSYQQAFMALACVPSLLPCSLATAPGRRNCSRQPMTCSARLLRPAMASGLVPETLMSVRESPSSTEICEPER